MVIYLSGLLSGWTNQKTGMAWSGLGGFLDLTFQTAPWEEGEIV